jgi:hypothetical protein
MKIYTYILSFPICSVPHKSKTLCSYERRIKKGIGEINWGKITNVRIMLHSALTFMDFWEGGSLNEKDAIPQSVCYKSAARRRENPTVLLRAGYSSNNVITLC